MNRYRHFDDEFASNNTNTAAILPEIDIDEPFSVEINPQLQNYPSNFIKCKIFLSRRTYLERFLLFLTILLLIVLFIIILISLYYHKQTSTNSVCLTSTCIEMSHAFSSGMNQSIDPCEDFHEFTCGRWIRTNIIPKGQSSWSTTKEISQKNMIIIKNLLEQTAFSSLDNVEQEVVKYYQSCINQTEIDRLSIGPLENYFQVNLNFTLNQWINIDKNQTWQELFIFLTKIFSMKHTYSFILPIKIESDEKNSSWNNLYIDQPQLILGSRDYYVNSSNDNIRNEIIRKTYSQVSSEIFQLLGFNKDDSIQRINDIIQFETELAAVSLPMEILQKHDKTYNLMSLKQLQEQYKPIGLDILSFFNEIFNINSIKFNENDQIIILTPELMSNVSNIIINYLLTPNKSHIVIDHFLLSFVLGLSTHLPLNFKTSILKLQKELYGTDSLPEQWEYCVKQTDAAFGFGLGALYIKAAFGETDRLKGSEIIKNIREIFRDNLNKLSWIDSLSKNAAKKKLEKIYEKIGYPDFITDQTKLNERYAGYIMMENEFFNNGIKVINRERRRTIKKYREKVDRTEWRMTPRTVNAYYSISSNEIVFPAGILQPPYFHKDLPISLNYGAIGMVIGHEITHGFDNQGREFDSEGNMRSWWTSFSLQNFEEKTKCFIKQYSNFAIDGQNENGERTLGENIADNGGIKLSYSAYKKHEKKTLNTGNNLGLPGLNYTADQLFFIAFAYSWCSIETSNALHYALINDPHSTARFRIIGTVQNSDEFAKAFSCKSKSKMNPSDKCQLW